MAAVKAWQTIRIKRIEKIKSENESIDDYNFSRDLRNVAYGAYKIKYYKNNFSDKDFYELKDILDKIKGKYLMNINYNDFVVSLFGEPDMKVEIKNNLVNNKYIKNSRRYELFYYN